MGLEFSVNEAKAEEWLSVHRECIFNACSGGHFTYHFTPTGLGVITEITCNSCKEVVNLTDYESW